MKNITLSQPTFYRGGQGGVSALVGYENGLSRVARYQFTAPAAGASQVELTLTGLICGTEYEPRSLGFYIGADPDSHLTAGPDSPCTGVLQNLGQGSFSVRAQALLLPEQTLYLFLFPLEARLGWFTLELATASLSVSGGSHSIPTAPARAELGTALTVTTNRHLPAFTHSLSLRFGGQEQLLGEGIGESFTWTPPLELANQLPNTTQGSASLVLTTFDGQTQIGSPQSVELTLAVPEWMTPSVSATWLDTSPARLLGCLVKLVSALQVEVTAAGSYGSTVVSSELFLQDKPYFGGTLPETGEVRLTVTVTDSRERTASVSYLLSVLDYAVPRLSLTASRCRSDGTPDDTGEFALVTLSGGISPLEGQNRAELTTSFGQTLAVEEAFGETFLIPAPSEQPLTLSATLTDALTATEQTMVLSVGYATLDLLRGGRGIAFGTTATGEGFTCAMPARFTGGLFVGEAALFPQNLPHLESLTPHFFLGKPVYSRVVTVPAGLTEVYHGIPVEHALWAAGTVWGARFDGLKITLPEAAPEEAHLLLCYTKGESL